jgi:hypothetical protein
LLLTISTRSRENWTRDNAGARRVRTKKGNEILLLAGHTHDSAKSFRIEVNGLRAVERDSTN